MELPLKTLFDIMIKFRKKFMTQNLTARTLAFAFLSQHISIQKIKILREGFCIMTFIIIILVSQKTHIFYLYMLIFLYQYNTYKRLNALVSSRYAVTNKIKQVIKCTFISVNYSQLYNMVSISLKKKRNLYLNGFKNTFIANMK